MTTSLAFLTHGQLWRAILAHPFGVLVYIYVAILVAIVGVSALTRRSVTVKLEASWRHLALAMAVVWASKLIVWYFVAR